MNKVILKIALPNIISNITVPLMGIISTAIAGHLGGDSAVMIGELAIGASIFNFIYWSSSFIRMGTSGLTAQAFGRGDFSETSRMLIRAMLIAVTMGVLILIFRKPIAHGTVALMNGGEIALEYIHARIWAIPAGIMLFAFHGWYNGMQNAVIPMSIAIFVNTLHVVLSLYLAFNLDYGVTGIAYASVISQWIGVFLSVVLLFIFYGKTLCLKGLEHVFDLAQLKELFAVNRDIIIRTACNVVVYFSFTAFSAHMEDKNILAVNALLMELFTLFAYMTDGFAYAAEALVGRFVGAKDRESLIKCIGKCMRWSLVISAIFVFSYLIGWREILGWFMVDQTSRAEVIALAEGYIGWIILIPLIGSLPFMLDGVMVGTTLTGIMRNSMLVSTVLYFGSYFALVPLIGNNAIWFAFTFHIIVRGVFQYIMTHRMQDIYNRA